MCQTVKESVQQQYAASSKQSADPKIEGVGKVQSNDELQETCPSTCPCRQTSYLPLAFNILGVLFAVFATYMMVTTDSNLYLIFWICYSVLRRMMGKNRTLKMKKD